MIRKLIQGGKAPSEFDLHIDGDRGDATYTLVYAGARWQKPWQGSKAIRVSSDGNKVTAIIYKDAAGRKAETIELGFDEAADLAMTLLEFTKDDPHAHNPLYEVYDKVETPVAKKLVFTADKNTGVVPNIKAVKKPKKAGKKARKKRILRGLNSINDLYGMGG